MAPEKFGDATVCRCVRLELGETRAERERPAAEGALDDAVVGLRARRRNEEPEASENQRFFRFIPSINMLNTHNEKCLKTQKL